MNKTLRPLKLLPLWIALSSVIIIAGIILSVLLGFNTTPDIAESNVFEVNYNIVVELDETAKASLEKICEDTFSANGVTVLDKQEATGVDTSSLVNVIRYTVSEDVSEATRTAIKDAIDSKVKAGSALGGEYAEVSTGWHPDSLKSTADYLWRGAIAVGIVVALVYVGVRFGIGCALTGLTLAVHDSLFVVALLAIARVPVYATAPVFYAAIAAAVSVALWLVHCMKLRDIKKEARTVEAEEAVAESWRGAWKWIVAVSCTLIAVLLVVGLVSVPGVRTLVLPALLSVVAALYSSLLLGPALHVHIKRGFDKLSHKRRKGYSGKQKQVQE